MQPDTEDQREQGDAAQTDEHRLLYLAGEVQVPPRHDVERRAGNERGFEHVREAGRVVADVRRHLRVEPRPEGREKSVRDAGRGTHDYGTGRKREEKLPLPAITCSRSCSSAAACSAAAA